MRNSRVICVWCIIQERFQTFSGGGGGGWVIALLKPSLKVLIEIKFIRDRDT